MGRRRTPPRLTWEQVDPEARDALAAGDEVEVVRDGRPVGTLRMRPSVVEGVVVSAPSPLPSPVDRPATAGVTVVATAVPLTDEARQRLSDRLGEDHVVLDVNDAPDTADVVLVHPVSPQLVGLLRSRFTRAEVIVTEIDDDALGVSRPGPVTRLLDAGAATYLPPRSIDEVAQGVRAHLAGREARALGPASARRLPGAGGATDTEPEKDCTPPISS